ncbi:MAG: hypothetical protein ACOX6Q_00110 [Candidatus Dojkabacteria bacterium]|jgi:hypothetical protein
MSNYVPKGSIWEKKLETDLQELQKQLVDAEKKASTVYIDASLTVADKDTLNFYAGGRDELERLNAICIQLTKEIGSFLSRTDDLIKEE